MADYTPSALEVQEAWIATYAHGGYINPEFVVQGQDEFKQFIKQVKAEVFEEGWYYASNGKWGSLEPGENPYAKEETA